MINKEDIIKEAYSMSENCIEVSYVDRMIRNIYDSIGTCKECDRWERFIPTDKLESRFGNCFLDNNIDNIWGDDDYCSKFERKEQ